MALTLLVDEDIQARRLVRLLVEVGHDILTVNDAGLSGQPDAIVFRSACESGRALLTRNPADFLALHQHQPDHPGILAVYQDHDPAKNMSYADIARAIENLESVGVALPSAFHVLNNYRW